MRRLCLAVTTLALLMIPLAATPASAAATCEGRPATHEGTNGPDHIVGTSGHDVIVAKGGDDEIHGRAGKDVICAGPGDDLVSGGGYRDRILGGRGRDVLYGDSPYQNVVDGGPGTDWCQKQRGWNHLITGCERADLVISVVAPEIVEDGSTFTVDLVVTNHGPDHASYTLELSDFHTDVTCTGWPQGDRDARLLKVGNVRTIAFEIACNSAGVEPQAWFFARVKSHGYDPRNGNIDSVQVDVSG
jgi:RTX calcium-binding nonapeptide repeat (4 copies)